MFTILSQYDSIEGFFCNDESLESCDATITLSERGCDCQ